MKVKESRLRFAPSTLRRLGEELIPNIDQGIVELVRNAYDADATECVVEVKGHDKPGGEITITDNGDGMNLQAITDSWLVLGASEKATGKLTKLNRQTVGDKGLGRLSALRAGREAELVTRRKAEEAFSVKINWLKFDDAKVVEDVPLAIESTQVPFRHGTQIRIQKLRTGVSNTQLERLARSLALLTNPFESNNGFVIRLKIPDRDDLSARVEKGYLTEAEYKLVAEIHIDGTASATVYDWKGAVQWKSPSSGWKQWKDPSDAKYAAPPLKFELYNYTLNKTSFAARNVTVKEVREWLSTVGGVHIYHRQFRVPPYGDPGHDWLDMNLARARSPEERPSTNNSVGRILIDDPDGKLFQKTDRVGFIENKEFQELKRFAKDAIGWFVRERLRQAEKRRASERQEIKKTYEAAKVNLEKVVQKAVSPSARKQAKAAINHFELAVQRALKSHREDLLLYRALATAGTTAAVFAHEVGKPISTIEAAQKSIGRRIKTMKPRASVEKLDEPLDLIKLAAAKLTNFAEMQIELLRREKRAPGVIDIHKVVREIHRFFSPIMADPKIKLELHLAEGAPKISGSEALVEALVTNCLTNAVRIFEARGAKREGRRVVIRTILLDESVAIEIEDNGPGISIPIEDIWLPGKTTYATGTGFGLTIAKDSVLDLGGTYSAEAKGALGGALIRFEIPRLKL